MDLWCKQPPMANTCCCVIVANVSCNVLHMWHTSKPQAVSNRSFWTYSTLICQDFSMPNIDCLSIFAQIFPSRVIWSQEFFAKQRLTHWLIAPWSLQTKNRKCCCIHIPKALNPLSQHPIPRPRLTYGHLQMPTKRLKL